VELSGFSSYKIGGRAKYFFQPKTVQEIFDCVKKAKEENLPIFILGGGTNLLIDDKGYEGVVIHPELKDIEMDVLTIKVGAGVDMNDLLEFVVENELSGLEWAGGLPGTFGGAVRGNAGAFQGEIKDLIQEVESLDISLDTPEFVKRNYGECEFGYRTSVFKKNDGKEIILSAVLKLKKGNRDRIKKAIQEKIDYRNEKHPMQYPNAGSIFKNIDVRKLNEKQLERFKHVMKTDPFPVIPVAYIISEAGLKGKSCGDAMISEKHPNFIINKGKATSEDVKKLISLIKKTVKQKFDIFLEEEVIYLG